jgi:hypothetical protein
MQQRGLPDVDSQRCAPKVRGDAQLPTPAARYSWERSDAQQLSVGEGAFQFHVGEVNLVVNL